MATTGLAGLSLTFNTPVSAVVFDDETIVPSSITDTTSTIAANRAACLVYYESEWITRDKFNNFFTNPDKIIRTTYLNLAKSKLDKSVAGIKLLEAYNKDNGYTGTVNLKEKIDYTVDMTQFDNAISSITNVIGSAFNTSTEFQLIFKFIVGPEGPTRKNYSVGVGFKMT
jgi:hypothetical protein